MIYLASPYSDPDWMIREQRYLDVSKIVVKLYDAGVCAYSSIMAWHNIVQKARLPRKFSYYQQIDFEMIDVCDRFVILCLDGWDNSVGVLAEIEYAGSIGREVEHLWVDKFPGLDDFIDTSRQVEEFNENKTE